MLVRHVPIRIRDLIRLHELRLRLVGHPCSGFLHKDKPVDDNVEDMNTFWTEFPAQRLRKRSESKFARRERRRGRHAAPACCRPGDPDDARPLLFEQRNDSFRKREKPGRATTPAELEFLLGGGGKVLEHADSGIVDEHVNSPHLLHNLTYSRVHLLGVARIAGKGLRVRNLGFESLDGLWSAGEESNVVPLLGETPSHGVTDAPAAQADDHADARG
mmetsp:Transcript_27975/g.76922  ORF Transcript_27975/g.76922 Transcript_27975/m.76922 type:complete len:217 (-) Transcript_27975:55-705(-)